MKNIIASTGDIQKDYDVIDIVQLYHSDGLDKELTGKKDPSFMEVFEAMKEKLKNKVSEMEGNGIIFLRFNWIYSQQGYSAMNKLHMYGTAVKFK